MSRAEPRGHYLCRCCDKLFSASIYERNKGWARFCGQTCNANHRGVIAKWPAIVEMAHLMLPTMATHEFADFVGIPRRSMVAFAARNNIYKSNAWLRASRQSVEWPEDPGLREVSRLKKALVRAINKRQKELE